MFDGDSGVEGLRALRAVLLSRSKSGTLAGLPSRPSARHQSSIKVVIKAGSLRIFSTFPAIHSTSGPAPLWLVTSEC